MAKIKKVSFQLGYKSQAWFTANPSRLLKVGEIVFLSTTGQYKIGDGSTVLSGLSFYGGSSATWGSIGGTLANQADLVAEFATKQNTITTGTTSQYFRGDLSLATFPTALSQFTNDSNFITSGQAASTYEPIITAGTTSQYWRGDKTWQTLNTSIVTEGTNLYYTAARFNTAFASKTTGDLSEGSNLYYTQARFDSAFSAKSTTDLSEGTNKYFTEARVLASVLAGLSITGSSISASDSVLSAFGKLQNQINGVLGGAIYQGVWNANTNSPTLASGVGTKGYYYVVSVAGATNLDGTTDWKIGDWAIFNGTTWDKVDNTDAVSSVNGAIGAVSLTGTSNRLSVSGTVFDIDAAYIGQSSITTLGTITTGTWTGSSISTTYTDAKIKTVTGTSNRLTVAGTSTDPTFDISTSYVGQATITTLGTIATGVWQGTTVGAVYGGTGQTTVTTGDLLYGSASNVWSKLAAVAAGSYLRSAGTGTAPVWSTLILPNSITANRIVYGSATNTYGSSANFTYDGTSVIAGDGTAVFGTPTYYAGKNSNTSCDFIVYQQTSGTAARTRFFTQAGLRSANLFCFSEGYTTSGYYIAGTTMVEAIGGGLGLATNGAFSINFYTNNNSTARWAIDSSGHLNATDAMNVILGTTTGTKYGTATSQKQGWYNATPIVQQTTGVASATYTANASANILYNESTFNGYTIAQVVKALQLYGFLA